MDLNPIIEELRKELRNHGYSASTIRSYCYYSKDFLVWVSSQKALGRAVNAKHAVAGYGLHLQEERKLGASAVNQGISAVSFFLRNPPEGKSFLFERMV